VVEISLDSCEMQRSDVIFGRECCMKRMSPRKDFSRVAAANSSDDGSGGL
jgi:hypothetical protein